jgi:putative tricarboxylic transport membrane protein
MGNEIVNLLSLFSPITLMYLFLGTFLGIVVGALPGLTATMAVSILISLTYGLSAANAIVVLIAVYLGGIYGGSRSAILLNVPGTPSSAATALDGFPLTLKGEGGRAGVVVTSFSALGGLFGLIILAVATPLIARFALKFGYWEYFWLAMMGVLISASITTGDGPNYKGIIAGFIGMLVSCVGIDPIHGFPRMIFGYSQMMGGINLVPAMIGLFGMAEAFDAIKNPKSHEVMELKKKESLPAMIAASFKMVLKYPRATVQAGLIGTFIGALPVLLKGGASIPKNLVKEAMRVSSLLRPRTMRLPVAFSFLCSPSEFQVARFPPSYLVASRCMVSVPGLLSFLRIRILSTSSQARCLWLIS